MNIAVIVRPTLYASPGGDTVQIVETVRQLRQLGIGVTVVFSHETFDADEFDLLHFFNIIRPDDILPHLRRDLPFVVSTIFVDYSDYEKRSRRGTLGFLFRGLSSGQIEYAKAVARWLKNGDRVKSWRYLGLGHRAAIRHIVGRAACLLPNSHSEYRRLAAYVGMDAPYARVVNAIDPQVFDIHALPNSGFRDHVLCVGRIEGRKNQLSLIEACIGLPVQLTIVGKPSPNHRAYYAACRALAEGHDNIHFIEHLDHAELVRIYQAAKVHVLPSWFETTGLSSLEAAVMGCNVVVTRQGDTEEYFEELAYYCEPDDVASIRAAVMRAYRAPFEEKLRERILNRYVWGMAAAQTLAAYRRVLEKC